MQNYLEMKFYYTHTNTHIHSLTRLFLGGFGTKFYLLELDDGTPNLKIHPIEVWSISFTYEPKFKQIWVLLPVHQVTPKWIAESGELLVLWSKMFKAHTNWCPRVLMYLDHESSVGLSICTF